MSAYTTGEVAKLCGVSVRTVQFYDAKGLLKPTALSEGGRRLYSLADLTRLRLICVLKSIGLSLDSIMGILSSEKPEAVLKLLLDEQDQQIGRDIQAMEKRRETIRDVRETIQTGLALSIESIADMDSIMDETKKRKRN